MVGDETASSSRLSTTTGWFCGRSDLKRRNQNTIAFAFITWSDTTSSIGSCTRLWSATEETGVECRGGGVRDLKSWNKNQIWKLWVFYLTWWQSYSSVTSAHDLATENQVLAYYRKDQKFVFITIIWSIYLPGNCGLHQIFLLATVCTSVSGLLFATPRNKLKICQNLRQPPTHQLPGRAISTFIPHRIAWCSTINNWVIIIALLHKWV